MTFAIELAYWQQTILRTIGVLLAVLVPAGTFVYVFLFKMVSFMQSRLGPMEAGPYGSMQLFAEVGKFIQKEDIVPDAADKRLFKLAPYIIVASVLLTYFVVPFGPDAVFANIDVGIFFALAVSSISVIGILIAGWASANKYSLLGALRAAGQLIAYELPLVLAVIGVAVEAGTMSMQGIVAAQAHGEIFGIAFALAAIAATLFLGGWYVPGVTGTAADVLGPVVLGAKIMAVAFLIFWIRFTYPRFREDQLQTFAWKYLIPISLVNIVVTGVLKVVL